MIYEKTGQPQPQYQIETKPTGSPVLIQAKEYEEFKDGRDSAGFGHDD